VNQQQPLSADVDVPVLRSPQELMVDVVADPATLDTCIAALEGGAGPLAVDVERAGGYRYSQRAYLVQFHRRGSGTWLIDPIAVPNLTDLGTVINGLPWVLHSAGQDLPSLAELELAPKELFDTELAARILGLERVGLAAVIEHYLGYTLAKAHSAADWSIRPLPAEWLAYAALDVEPLVDLHDSLRLDLIAANRLDWVRQECEFVRHAPGPTPRQEPWRRTRGLKSRTPRSLAITRELWLARDEVARSTDKAPGRVLTDAAIAALVAEPPPSVAAMRELPHLRRQSSERLRTWLAAIERGLAAPATALPSKHGPAEDPPNPRAWERLNPLAASRYDAGRACLTEVAEELGLPRENLISPKVVREAIWKLSGGSQPAEESLTTADVAHALSAAGARAWQVALTVGPLSEAFTSASLPSDD